MSLFYVVFKLQVLATTVHMKLIQYRHNHSKEKKSLSLLLSYTKHQTCKDVRAFRQLFIDN